MIRTGRKVLKKVMKWAETVQYGYILNDEIDDLNQEIMELRAEIEARDKCIENLRRHLDISDLTINARWQDFMPKGDI